MKVRKLFGTDGIRGKANIYPMTGDIAFALGRAVTHYFQKQSKQPMIVLGKDTRLSCYMLEQAFSAGVCSQGGFVVLTGPLPTPGVAYVTRSMRADAGIMISASHNSFEDNGIKIFNRFGLKLSDEVELELEELVLNPNLIPVRTKGELGRAKRLDEVFGRYIVFVKSALPIDYSLEDMKIVLDCSNGAGYKIAPIILEELGAKVYRFGVFPNGQNINQDCGSMHPEKASEKVKEKSADIGICLDGDADRVVIIDEKGDVVNGDRLIALFAKMLLDQGKLQKGDTVVGTVMSNLGLEKYLESIGLKFHRTKVGDRYIIEYMKNNNCVLGGEPSGHVIFWENGTTGDGIIAGLKAIECMRYYKDSMSNLAQNIFLYPQKLVNVKVSNKPALSGLDKVQTALKLVEEKLKDKGRVLLRYSGTESKLRVMAEAKDVKDVDWACDELVTAINEEIGS